MKYQFYEKWFDSIYDILDDDIKFTKRKRKGNLAEIPVAFDIEASSFRNEYDEKQATMYCWVLTFNGKSIRGRTWDEFIQCLDVMQEKYNLSIKRRIVIYVHNLSYEFQWIQHRLNWVNVFAVDKRTPVYAICDKGIEFRCSYILSGYSLENVGRNLVKYKASKKVGDLNYDLMRHSQTPLTETEWEYVLNDGIVCCNYIAEQIEQYGSIGKIPLTNTGRVRNLCRDKMFNGPNRYDNASIISSLKLDEKLYKQSVATYQGGFTHANHKRVGKTYRNVSSYDFTSSYPAVILSEKFPMSTPQLIEIKSKDDFYKNINSYACMFQAMFINIREKFTCEHYISKHKCTICKNPKLDNGRIVKADAITIYLTEIDFKIIEQTYEWDELYINDFYKSYKGYLPKDLIECVLELYEKKTKLKGVETESAIIDYLNSKGLLNAIYGMMCTSIIKDELKYDNARGWYSELANVDEALNKYNNSKTRFIYYIWGIYVCAFARYNLWSAILECGDDYIYSDTDSVKILNRENHLQYFEKYDKQIKKKIKDCLSINGINPNRANPKNVKGEAKPIGIWTYEGTYSKFKTLGAKRYIYYDDNDIHITISGVNKKCGQTYLKYKFGSISNIFKNFNDGLSFPSIYLDENGIKQLGCGKMCHTYIDIIMNGILTDYLGNDYEYNELSGMHLEATSYDLSLEKNFINYLLETENDGIILW